MEDNKEPNLIDKAKSLGSVAARWMAKDNFARVSNEQFTARKNICLSCPYWDAEAFGNTGRCKLCGCSVMKLYIPNAKCPHNPPKWDSISVS